MSTELAQTLLFFLAGGILIFLAITVARDNFANRLNRATGGLLFFAGLGPIAVALSSIVQLPMDGTTGGAGSSLINLYHLWEFVFPTLIIFSWYFPVDRVREFKHPRWRYLIFIPQVVHIVLVLFLSDIDSLLDMLSQSQSQEGFASLLMKPFAYILRLILLFISFILSSEEIVFGSVNILYVLVGLYFLENGRRLQSNPSLTPQTNTVVRGLMLGLGLYALTFVVWQVWPQAMSLDTKSSLLLLATLIGTGFLTFAIVRYQFLDVRLVFRQSLVYTLTSAILVGLYMVVGVQSMEFTRPIFGDKAEIVSYVIIILLLLMFQPISSWIDNTIRSMFMRTRSDHRNVIERFSREIISIFDPRQLRQTIEETLKTAVLVERVYFVLFDDSVGEYALLQSDDNARRVILDRGDLMLRGINLLDRPTNFDTLMDYREDSRLGDILHKLGVRLILPMKDTEHLLGFVGLTSKVAGYRYSPEDYNMLGVLSNQMVSALTNARLYVDSLERIRLQEEVTMARQIQLDLLPSNPPQLDCSVICADSTPSRTVGGDFYDFIPIEGTSRIGIVIADASGKGMPAALLIAQIQAIIRSEVNNGNSISSMLKNMNQQVAMATSSEKYVTLFYGELDADRGEFHYANAGHNYPILARANGDIQLLETGGPIIGAFPFMEYASTSVKLEPDDVLFLFTDGLSEAMDTNDVEYGEERIRRFICEHREMEPQKIMDMIVEDVRAFDPTYPPQDDTTIVTLKMTRNGQLKHE